MLLLRREHAQDVKVCLEPWRLLDGRRVVIGNTRCPQERRIVAGWPGVLVGFEWIGAKSHRAVRVEYVHDAVLAAVGGVG